MQRIVILAAAASLLAASAAALPARPDDRAEALSAAGMEAYDQGDARLAALLWRQGALLGSADAMTALGGLLEEGDGVSRNAAQARLWYARAARRGDPHAMVLLSELLGDDPAARPLLVEAAARGHGYAQRRLAQPPGEALSTSLGGEGEDQ